MSDKSIPTAAEALNSAFPKLTEIIGIDPHSNDPEKAPSEFSVSYRADLHELVQISIHEPEDAGFSEIPLTFATAHVSSGELAVFALTFSENWVEGHTSTEHAITEIDGEERKFAIHYYKITENELIDLINNRADQSLTGVFKNAQVWEDAGFPAYLGTAEELKLEEG